MSMTITEDLVRTTTTDDPGNATHIVRLPPHLRETTTPQAYVMYARFNGTMIEALCGHRWVPERDPAKYPICEACKREFEHDPRGHGDRDQLPEA